MVGSRAYQAFGPASAWIDEDYVTFKVYAFRAIDGEKTNVGAVKRDATCIAQQPRIPIIATPYRA